MKDPNIVRGISQLQNKIEEINTIISDLYEIGVEMKIAWRDDVTSPSTILNSKFVPHLELWRARHNVDYLKKEVN